MNSGASFFYNFLFYIRVELINNTVLVSGVQQSDSFLCKRKMISSESTPSIPHALLPTHFPHNYLEKMEWIQRPTYCEEAFIYN